MTTTAEYQVTGMTCAHCEQAVQNEVGQVPGVQSAAASATAGTLTVTGPAWDDAAVIAAVDEAGYEAVRIR